MNRKLGVKGLCCEETLVKEGDASLIIRWPLPDTDSCASISLRPAKLDTQIWKLPFLFSYLPVRSFAPSPYSTPQPPFARFLIILGQTAVGRCRWPSAWLHIASLTGTAAVKWPALLTSCSFFSITPPNGFITWHWRDMELRGKKICL